MPILSIFRGLPGSGKSTAAKKLGVLHLEADMYHMSDGKYNWQANKVKFAHDWCKRMTYEAMQAGMDVAVSNTFTRISEFQEYLELATHFGYEVRVFRCTGNYGNVHSVPVETLEKMKNRFEDFEDEIIIYPIIREKYE